MRPRIFVALLIGISTGYALASAIEYAFWPSPYVATVPLGIGCGALTTFVTATIMNRIND